MKKEVVFRVMLIFFAWVVSSGGLIKGHYFIAVLSGFVGVWLIAMPDHYEKGRGRMAWGVTFVAFIIVLGLLYRKGIPG